MAPRERTDAVDPDARFVTRLIISRRAGTMIGLVGIQYTHPLIDRLNAAINTSITCRPTKTSSTYTHWATPARRQSYHTRVSKSRTPISRWCWTPALVSINVIDEWTYATLRPRPKLQLFVNANIMTYGSSKSLPRLGRCEATFASKHRNCVDTAYVVRGNHACLLRYSTALQ